MAMKSARNPLTKQLPAVRRMSSDVQRGKRSKLDITLELATEQFPTDYSDETLANCSQSATEVGDGGEELEVLPVVEKAPSPVTSFQEAFLKMLQGDKKRRRPKPPKDVAKSKTAHRHHSAMLHKSASMPLLCANSVVFSIRGKADGTEDTTCPMLEANKTDSYETDAATPTCGQTSSVMCDSETISSLECSNGELVSLNLKASEEFCLADDGDVASVATLSYAVLTSVSCNFDDLQTSERETPYDATEFAILPPALSLPDPVVDTDACPPELEPSYLTAEFSLSPNTSVSDAVRLDISATREEKNVYERSKSSGGGTQNGEVVGAGMSPVASTVDATCGAVDALASSVSQPEMGSVSHAAPPPSLTLSNSTVAAGDEQTPHPVDSGITVTRPTSSTKCSSLRRVRPVISADILRPTPSKCLWENSRK